MIINMFSELRRGMDEHKDKYNRVKEETNRAEEYNDWN